MYNKQIINSMKYLKFLFSPVFMGALFIAFALSMAIATFIENDFGPAVSYSTIYSAWWFELIFVLLALNLTGQIIQYKLLRKEKLPVALFHLAFLLMISGAAITRYTGWEGSMHIREGEVSSTCFSGNDYLGYVVRDAGGKILQEYSEPYLADPASTDDFSHKIKTGSTTYELVLARIIANAVETISDSPDGEPMISLFVTNEMTTRETIVLKRGDSQMVSGLTIGFHPGVPTDITIESDSSQFKIVSLKPMGKMSMMGEGNVIINPGTISVLEPMQIFSIGNIKIVPQKLSMNAVVKPVPGDKSRQPSGINAYIFNLLGEGSSESFYLLERPSERSSRSSINLNGLEFEVFRGPAERTLPFMLRLNDFVLERYPGSSSPSGYRSEITLIDPSSDLSEPASIYMNNILKYRGYRFYQSSYDMDEKGTILSVNHDLPGMLVTYAGYAALFLFILLSLVIKNSSFRKLRATAWSSPLRKATLTLLVLLFAGSLSLVSGQMAAPDKDIATGLGRILVQDQKGRTKPLYTLSSDIVRKVVRENNYKGYSPMQVFAGIWTDFNTWKDIPIIRVSNAELQKIVGISGNMASFTDLVDIDGTGEYELADLVNEAYAKPPARRNKLDKEIMKVDERVNIVYMIYKGDFLKIFPLKDGSDKWGTADEALRNAGSREDSLYLSSVVPMLHESFVYNNSANARQIIESFAGYQERFASYPLPAKAKVNLEILYYKSGVFEKLFPFYFTVGILMLGFLIYLVLRGGKRNNLVLVPLKWILGTGFVFHTLALAARWYISGHSPMSNGYESMIFISWVTLLAGFFFSRRSEFTLSATAVLAGGTLMVAHLSFMDPEITNLVPVLKSYWLTLHVSVITGSYGFLGLGAVLGLISVILLSLVNGSNKSRISETLDELLIINYRSLTLGLYLLTIGTFLGAIWANESWGRYWGWDPKETWSLITIIVYTFVTHSRMIPGLKTIFSFNILALFGFSSVLMTYFGVNYYLSGLHSYAGGDPVPVPAFVYISVLLLIMISIIAYFKYSGLKKEAGNDSAVTH